ARSYDDVLRVDEGLRVHAAARAVGEHPGGGRALAAERALAHRGAQAVEEGVAAIQTVHQALVAEIAVGNDGLRTVLRDDRLPAIGDLGERLVPGDALELPAALGSRAAQGMKDAVGMVVAQLVVLELHAQAAAGHGVIRVAAHPDPPSLAALEDQ